MTENLNLLKKENEYLHVELELKRLKAVGLERFMRKQQAIIDYKLHQKEFRLHDDIQVVTETVKIHLSLSLM